jgi:hypothetical protein
MLISRLRRIPVQIRLNAMKKRLFPMIVASAIAWPVTCLADITVVPAGMKIVWKSLQKEFDGFQTYNSKEGAYINLAVNAGDKGIIGFDKDKSKLTISDGTNDLGGKFGMWNKFSKDNKAMRVEVSSEKLPSADAAHLKLTGKLELVMASKTETKACAAREFKKGDKVALSDDFKFEIDSIGKPKWGDDPLALTFKWNRKIPEFAAVRFYDEAGKEIESSTNGSSRSGFLGKYTVTKSYKLKKKSKMLKIEMDLWMDAENVSVPVDVQVGIGGSK